MASMRREYRIQTVCLLILSAIAGGAAMYWLRPVMVPFVLAVFFTYTVIPVIDWQVKKMKAPHWLAVFTTFLIGCAALGLLLLALVLAAAQTVSRTDDYRERLMSQLAEMSERLPLEKIGVEEDEFLKKAHQLSAQWGYQAITGAGKLTLAIVTKGLLVLIFMLFLMIGRVEGMAQAKGIRREVAFRVRRYLLVKATTSVITGALVGLVMTFLGVPFALVFGVLALLLNFIPSVGSIVATLLPVPIVLAAEMSPTFKALAIVIPGGIQFAIGNVIEPKIMGQSLDLHPVAVLISLIFFGMLWGVVGMFLAAPITAVVKILCEKEELTAPVANLLAGRVDDFFKSLGEEH